MFSWKLGGNTQVIMAASCPSYSELIVSWLHLPYFSSCFLIMLQLYPRSFRSCKEGENVSWMHLNRRNNVHASHAFWFISMQADISYCTRVYDMEKKNPVYCCYISDLYKLHFLKTYFRFQMQVLLDFSTHQYFCLPQ